MTKCMFKHVDGDIYQCIFCGFQVPTEHYVKECRADPQVIAQKLEQNKLQREVLPPIKPPSIMARAKNLAKAGIKHLTTGLHHCSPEDRIERFQICQSNQCKLFLRNPHDPTRGVCSHESCGCFIRAQGEFMDKLSWAESECPVGLWGPVEPESPENPENGV